MTTERLTAALLTTIKASGIPGLKANPKAVARFFGVPHAQAKLACRRLARAGALVGGRTA